MTETKSHCLKCKGVRPVENVTTVKTKNGRTMQKGKCMQCGTTCCKFIKG